MTTNQTIDGVPRKLVRENIAYLRRVGGTYDQKSALAAKFELLLLDPAPPKELREQYEAWADANGYDITRNEHGDYAGIVEDSMWTGWQARGELRALLDAPAINTDVRTILLDITPGMDGMGHEVYAKSVDDVEAVLSKQGDRIEEMEMEMEIHRLKAAQPQGETPDDDKSHPRFIAGYTAGLYDHKLGQPQGEPVAYRCRHSATEPWFFSDKPGYWEWQALYAEQPAPVAICKHCGWPHVDGSETCDDATLRERGKS